MINIAYGKISDNKWLVIKVKGAKEGIGINEHPQQGDENN
jgi:hypothetical protein